MISFVPHIIFDLICIVGILGIIASYVIKFIPFISQYHLPIQVLCIVLTVGGMYYEGKKARQDEYDREIAQLQVRIAESQAKSEQYNRELSDSIAENERLRGERKHAKQKIIEKVITKYDSNCKLSNAFVGVLNSSSQDTVPDSSTENDGRTSDVKASEVLGTVTDNYETYYKLRDEILGWQNWYKEQKRIFEEAQK